MFRSYDKLSGNCSQKLSLNENTELLRVIEAPARVVMDLFHNIGRLFGDDPELFIHIFGLSSIIQL